MKSDPGKWEEREGAGLSQVVRQLTAQHSHLIPFQHSLSLCVSLYHLYVCFTYHEDS